MMYTFCEPVWWATTWTPVHIREIPEGKELKFGGGIDTPTLCKRMPNYGWDIPGEVTEAAIDACLNREINPLCPNCADEWRRQQPGYIEPPAPTPSMQGQRLMGTWLDEAAALEDPF